MPKLVSWVAKADLKKRQAGEVDCSEQVNFLKQYMEQLNAASENGGMVLDFSGDISKTTTLRGLKRRYTTAGKALNNPIRWKVVDKDSNIVQIALQQYCPTRKKKADSNGTDKATLDKSVTAGKTSGTESDARQVGKGRKENGPVTTVKGKAVKTTSKPVEVPAAKVKASKPDSKPTASKPTPKKR